MDIKKFITSDRIDNDYNKMIQREIDATKNKINNNNKHYCLYGVSDMDFLKPTVTITEMFKDPNIIEFENLCIDVDANCVGYSGPMIKRYLDTNAYSKKLPIKNFYTVTLFGTKMKSKDIIKEKFRNTIKCKAGYYFIKTTNSSFYLDKKTYQNISQLVLANIDNLDRIILADHDLWVSGMFILDFYKKISCYDDNNMDPLFGYPEDILDIYDRSNTNTNSIKNMIDMINIEDLQAHGFDKNKLENTMIIHKEQKYTIIEYLLIKMMENNHPIITFQLRNMLSFLSSFEYFRPVWFVAKMIGFDKKYPGEYGILLEIKHKISLDPYTDTGSLESVYHIDMWILNHMIKTDNVDQFVDYISRMGIVKKFKQESKTAEKIIDWIIEYKSIKILNTLIECMVISEQHKYKLIFLIQEFNLLGREFIEKYVLKKIKIDKGSKQSKQLELAGDQSVNEVDANEQSNEPVNDNHRIKIIKKTDHDNTHTLADEHTDSDQDHDTDDHNAPDHGQGIDPDQDNGSHDYSHDSQRSNDNKSQRSNDNKRVTYVSNDQNKLIDTVAGKKIETNANSNELDLELPAADQAMILNLLQDILDRGLTRSFYMTLKLCPHILGSDSTPDIKTDGTLGYRSASPGTLGYRSASPGTLGYRSASPGTLGYRSASPGTILHTIRSDASVDILEIILKKNPEIIDNKDEYGRTALVKYAEQGLKQCVIKMIEFGADYEITDNKSDTFLHKLCENGNLDIIQHVVRNVTDIINVKNDKLMTPAIVATINRHEEIFYVLKGLSANLDNVDIYGNSVYHYICNTKICPGIMVVNKKNKFGFTPRDYCNIDHKFYHFQNHTV
jgi:hypothetical protein